MSPIILRVANAMTWVSYLSIWTRIWPKPSIGILNNCFFIWRPTTRPEPMSWMKWFCGITSYRGENPLKSIWRTSTRSTTSGTTAMVLRPTTTLLWLCLWMSYQTPDYFPFLPFLPFIHFLFQTNTLRKTHKFRDNLSEILSKFFI